MVSEIPITPIRNFLLVLFISSTITLLIIYIPTTLDVWINIIIVLIVAGFAIWKIGTHSYFNYVDITRFHIHVFGNIILCGLCCIMILLSVIILPFGSFLVSLIGYMCAISLGMMRIFNVYRKRKRFNSYK